MNNTHATINNVEVGTVITYAYWYSARIPKFARVTKRTPCGVQIETLEKEIVTDDGFGQNGSCIPKLDGPTHPVHGSFRFKKKSGNLVIDGCYAYIYEGNAEDFWSD